MQNKLLILLLTGLLHTALSSAQSRQPNLVLIFCDDMGYGDLACYGNPVIQTPNLDKMAYEGRKFTNFYATSPACTASRYSLMTGKYPVRSGFSWVLGPSSAKGIHPKERILPEALKEAGYATAIFGKWHLGTKKKQFLPLQNGFDVYYGLPYSNDMIPPRWGEIALMEGNDTLQMSPDQTLLTRNCTERAIRFMEAHRDQPFFIYLPFNMPHVPLNPGSQFAGSSPRGKYGDVVQEIDFCVGQLLEKLNELGLDENTLVLFTSDNGPWITQKQNAGSAGPLRDGKGSTWEGGMRVPAIARWPGKIPATSNESRPCATIDVYRSFCTLAGASPREHACDGLDISGLLGGEQTAFPEERVFFYYGPGNQLQAVRKGAWKLHIKTNSQLNLDYFDKKPPLLFHLHQDPGEYYECSDQYPERVAELLALIREHQQAVGPEPGFYDQERRAARRYHKAFGKTVEYGTPPHPRYNNPLSLTDGWDETPDEFNHIAGFRGDVMECTLDLDSILSIQHISIGFIQQVASWIFLPKQVAMQYSRDGINWSEPIVQSHAYDLKEEAVHHAFSWDLLSKKDLRFIRFRARSIGLCPDWHWGKGEQSWMFPDEIHVD